ncbi:MAG: type II toxin-antitoxin system RelE/ParE family toxin [Brevundimonas sp.]
MDLYFGSKKLEKTLSDQRKTDREFGQLARTLRLRLAVLTAAESLADVPIVPPERRHQLTNDRNEQFAVDLKQPHRLIFEVANDPIPRNDDGGIDLDNVTAITVVEIIDYH